MTYVIEDNVPIPTGPKSFTDAVRSLKNVGQSFFCEGKKKNSAKTAILTAAKETGFKYALREVTENDVEGVRVWRVS